MRAFTLMAVSCLFGASSASAQSHLGLEVTSTHYRGSARDTSGDPHARPGSATMFGIRFDHAIGNVRIGLRVSYSEPGLTIAGQGLTINDNSSGTLLESAA